MSDPLNMPPMDVRTGTPTDVVMVKRDADLPDAQLPVYRGENVKVKVNKGGRSAHPLTPEQMAVMAALLRGGR